MSLETQGPSGKQNIERDNSSSKLHVQGQHIPRNYHLERKVFSKPDAKITWIRNNSANELQTGTYASRSRTRTGD